MPPRGAEPISLLPFPFSFTSNKSSTSTTTTTSLQLPHSNKHLTQLLDIPVVCTMLIVQIISYVLVFNIEECSPLILFSLWRNKISWDSPNNFKCLIAWLKILIVWILIWIFFPLNYYFLNFCLHSSKMLFSNICFQFCETFQKQKFLFFLIGINFD